MQRLWWPRDLPIWIAVSPILRFITRLNLPFIFHHEIHPYIYFIPKKFSFFLANYSAQWTVQYHQLWQRFLMTSTLNPETACHDGEVTRTGFCLKPRQIGAHAVHLRGFPFLASLVVPVQELFSCLGWSSQSSTRKYFTYILAETVPLPL
jgi:hypothetical protein